MFDISLSVWSGILGVLVGTGILQCIRHIGWWTLATVPGWIVVVVLGIFVPYLLAECITVARFKSYCRAREGGRKGVNNV